MTNNKEIEVIEDDYFEDNYFDGCECGLCGQYLTPDGKCLFCEAEIDAILEAEELSEQI